MRITMALSALTFPVLALGSSGCAGGISGEIDDESVPSFSTAAAAEFDAGRDFDGVIGIWSSAGDACVDGTEHAKFQNDIADGDDGAAKDWEDYDAEHLPEEYWYAVLQVIADDIDDLEEEQEIELDDPDDDLAASLTVCHVKDYPEEKNDRIDTDEDCYVSNAFAGDGTIFVQYSHEGTLHVSTDGEDLIEVEEVDGNDDGDDLSFSGSAGYCDDLADELDD